MLEAIALGQLLSFFISLTGIFSSLLARQGVFIPASQSLLNYACLALVYGGSVIFSGRKVQASWYKYVGLALIDVLANFCLVLAYQYTSLTSVTLLDCFTVPCVLLLSWIWLGARYTLGHWVGALTCFAGLAFLVLSDRAFGGETQAPKPLLGDSLVLFGAALYAFSNVAQEKLLGKVSSIELLGFLGAFGSIWGSLLAASTEGNALRKFSWSHKVVLPFLGFNAALFAFSSLVPLVLRWGGAATLNLSLLSSDLWAALARLLYFGGFTPASGMSFAVSFLLVTAGIVIYSLSGEVKQPVKQAPPSFDQETQSRLNNVGLEPREEPLRVMEQEIEAREDSHNEQHVLLGSSSWPNEKEQRHYDTEQSDHALFKWTQHVSRDVELQNSTPSSSS